MTRSFAVLLLIAGLSWSVLGDDHGDSPLTATPVSAVGELVSACIEQPGDLDYFLFAAVEGRTYRLLTSHLSDDMDTVLFLFDSDGRSILLVDDDSNGETASRLQWTCVSSGTYFVMVRHARALVGTGCYEFSLSTLLVDDHGDDVVTATPLALNSPATGFVETADDIDVFLFSVRRGFEYSAYLAETTASSDLHLEILDEDGTTPLLGRAARGDPELTWTATATTTLFAAVSATDGSGAGYDIVVRETGYVDDYGNEPATAHPLPAEGTAIDGMIDVDGDRDWFTFDARRDTEYRIGLVAVAACRLALLAADGTTVIRETLSAAAPVELAWTAPANGAVYVTVEAPGGIGAYALTVSSTLQLELLATFNPQGYSLDVAVRGTIAHLVVGTKGLLLVDVSDPAQPREIGAHSTRGYAQAVAISGDFAYVANRGEGLTILDVSDPTRPVEAASIDTEGSAQDVVVIGPTAYLADQRGGVQIVDVAQPVAPRLLATYETRGPAEAIAVRNGVVFAAIGDAGLEIVDVADPTAPTQIATLDLRGDASDVVVTDGLAFVAAGFRGIRVVDLRDLAMPTEIGYLGTEGEARGLALTTGFLYVAERTEGLSAYALADPENPELVARIDTPGEAVRVAIAGGVAFVADRERGMQVIRLFP